MFFLCLAKLSQTITILGDDQKVNRCLFRSPDERNVAASDGRSVLHTLVRGKLTHIVGIIETIDGFFIQKRCAFLASGQAAPMSQAMSMKRSNFWCGKGGLTPFKWETLRGIFVVHPRGYNGRTDVTYSGVVRSRSVFFAV